MEFKVGELVKCIDNDWQEYFLTENKFYEIETVSELHIEVKDDQGIISKYLKIRFEPRKSSKVHNFEIGDKVVCKDLDSSPLFAITLNKIYEIVGVTDRYINIICDEGRETTYRPDKFRRFGAVDISSDKEDLSLRLGDIIEVFDRRCVVTEVHNNAYVVLRSEDNRTYDFTINEQYRKEILPNITLLCRPQKLEIDVSKHIKNNLK